MFLYNSNKKIKKLITSFTIVSTNVRYLRLNLKNSVEGLYTKKLPSIREILKDLN